MSKIICLLTLLLSQFAMAGAPVIFNGADAQFINSGSVIVPGLSAGACTIDGAGKFGSVAPGSSGNALLSDGSTWNSTALPSNALTHFYYVDKSGADSSSCGSVSHPCLTIQQAATNIGSAASNAEFNDATKEFYYVKPIGAYTETVTFGTRPNIVLDMGSAVINGDLIVQYNQGAIFGANNQQPHFTVRGDDLRAGYGGLFGYSGVNGNVFFESVGSGGSLIAQLHMINTGVTGDIHQRLGTGGGIFTLSTFLTGTMVTGKVICDTSPSAGALTLYANNSDTSGSRAIGGATGSVQIYQIHNVRFNGVVSVTGSQGGRWFDVQFSALAHDFSGASGTTSMDANTFDSWNSNVPTKGSVTASLLDNANGVKYTPTTSSDWASVPATVLAALDNLAGGALKKVLVNGASSATNAVFVYKDGHLKSSQTTAPVPTVNANAGTGATCTVSNATDSAGTANLTTTAVASASGAQCSIAFNKTYNVAPICVLSATSSASSLSSVTQGIYFTTSTSALVINFANADLTGATYNWAYNCIETQ